MARYWSKIADCNLPHLYLAPPLGVTPIEIRRDLRHHGTRVPVLSYGVVCVILCLAILVQYQRVTDGQTRDDSIYCASIASRGKNLSLIFYGQRVCDVFVEVVRRQYSGVCPVGEAIQRMSVRAIDNTGRLL